jgi:hypothetical protein
VPEKGANDREFTVPVEQALIAKLSKRALAFSSKLAIEKCAGEQVFLGEIAPLLGAPYLPRDVLFSGEYREHPKGMVLVKGEVF